MWIKGMPPDEGIYTVRHKDPYGGPSYITSEVAIMWDNHNYIAMCMGDKIEHIVAYFQFPPCPFEE